MVKLPDTSPKLVARTNNIKGGYYNPRRCAAGLACYRDVLEAATAQLVVLPDKRIGRVCPVCAEKIKASSSSESTPD